MESDIAILGHSSIPMELSALLTCDMDTPKQDTITTVTSNKDPRRQEDHPILMRRILSFESCQSPQPLLAITPP